MRKFLLALASFLVLSFSAKAHSATPIERYLSIQTWQSLQGLMVMRIQGDPLQSLKTRYFRRAGGDFAVRSTAQDYHFMLNGRFWAQVPGQSATEEKAAGACGAFVAMHRLLFAGEAETGKLELVSSSGERIRVRWADWPGSDTLTVEMDAQGRAKLITDSSGTAIINEIVYQVGGNKIYPSSWRQQSRGLIAAAKSGEPADFWLRYTLEEVTLDGMIPAEVFVKP